VILVRSYADFIQTHSVKNQGKTDRIHLVLDCKVNEYLTSLFIQEGILSEEEKPPIQKWRKQTKREIINNLRRLGTETAEKIIQELTS